MFAEDYTFLRAILIHLLYVLNNTKSNWSLSITNIQTKAWSWLEIFGGGRGVSFILSLISLLQGFLNYIGVSKMPGHTIPDCFANPKYKNKIPKHISNNPWYRKTFFSLVEDKVVNLFFSGYVQWYVYEN